MMTTSSLSKTCASVIVNEQTPLHKDFPSIGVLQIDTHHKRSETKEHIMGVS